MQDRKGPLVAVGSFTELPPPSDMGLGCGDKNEAAEDFNDVREQQALARAEHRRIEAEKKALKAWIDTCIAPSCNIYI